MSYILFSVIAALAMWSLARRFCGKPFLATLLFIAVPAFVVNGNSLEADLPFLAEDDLSGKRDDRFGGTGGKPATRVEQHAKKGTLSAVYGSIR